MRTNIIQIGNSRGIRIPKALLEECKLSGAVELEVRAGQLIVRAVENPRDGWEEAFRQMAEHGDDELLDWDLLEPTEWDASEWEW